MTRKKEKFNAREARLQSISVQSVALLLLGVIRVKDLLTFRVSNIGPATDI